MTASFTDREKIEVIEQLLVIEKDRAERRDHNVLLILKEIARDMRAREPERANEAIRKIEGAITVAEAHKGVGGYKVGHLMGIGQLVVRFWPTIRTALEQLEQRRRSS